MLNERQIAELASSIFRDSLAETNYSKRYMARAMHKDKKTIDNWLNGITSPDLKTFIEWFDVLGVPIYPYLIKIAHNSSAYVAHTKEESILNELISHAKDMSETTRKKRLWELSGGHGSDPEGITELITAYLHLPLDRKVCIAGQILTQFFVAQAEGELVHQEEIMPDTDKLRRCCNAAMKAIEQGKETYIVDETKQIEGI